MKTIWQNQGTENVCVKVQMDNTFVSGLRQFLHVEEGQPITFNSGSIKLQSCGFGWYVMYPFNPKSKGKDLEFAVKQLELFQKRMDQRVLDEFKWLRNRPHAMRQLSVEQQERFKAAMERHIKATAKPASVDQLHRLRNVVNNRYGHNPVR